MPVGAIFEALDKHRAELLAGDRRSASRLVTSYGRAWTATHRELAGTLAKLQAAMDAGEEISPAWWYQKRRLEVVQATLEDELRRFGRDATLVVQNRQADAIEAAQAHTTELLSHFPGAGVTGGFEAIPLDAMGDLVGFMGDGSPLRAVFASMGPDAGDALQRVLTTGLARGLSPRQMVAEARHALGGQLNRALTIARTETLRSYRESTRRRYDAEPAVAGWTWVCACDARSCAACWAMHGRQFPTDEQLDGHPNCRCTMVPLTRTWDELAGVGTGATETRLELPLADDAFARLPEHERLAILGRAKLDAYNAGELDLGDLVGRRSSSAWGTTRGERSLRDVRAAKANGVADELERLGPTRLPDDPSPARPSAIAEGRLTAARARDANLAAIAERDGLDPDELARARSGLGDLRRAARLEGQVAQRQALARLESADALKMARPPRLKPGARGRGVGGEWDWLDRLSPADRKRLSRDWFSGSHAALQHSGPDQVAERIAQAWGITDPEEAMAEWVRTTRLADAGGALARGKPAAYLDAAELAPETTRAGFNVARLFDPDELEAAAHAAGVWGQSAADDAWRVLDTYRRHGPPPWEMSEAAFETELREVEYDLSAPHPPRQAVERYLELVPPDLDDPPLPFDQLYREIRRLARRAGLL